jgi:hypothetical protein
MLEFDKFGFLTPYDAISSDFETLESNFLFNEQRTELYLELLHLLRELQKEEIDFIKIWINGSFISQKEHPKDIDVVFFVDFSVYLLHEKYLLMLYRNRKRIDCQFIALYPENHKKHFLSVSDSAEYRHNFSRNWKSPLKQHKGFLEILSS